jgi:hypothetical protein
MTVFSTSKRTLALLAGAVLCLGCAGLLRSQESWGMSSWQTGSAKGASAPTASIANGGDASWSAGKGTTSTGAQAGGVWRDGSNLTSTASGATYGLLPPPPALGSFGSRSSKGKLAGSAGGLHFTPAPAALSKSSVAHTHTTASGHASSSSGLGSSHSDSLIKSLSPSSGASSSALGALSH